DDPLAVGRDGEGPGHAQREAARPGDLTRELLERVRRLGHGAEPTNGMSHDGPPTTRGLYLTRSAPTLRWKPDDPWAPDRAGRRDRGVAPRDPDPGDRRPEAAGARTRDGDPEPPRPVPRPAARPAGPSRLEDLDPRRGDLDRLSYRSRPRVHPRAGARRRSDRRGLGPAPRPETDGQEPVGRTLERRSRDPGQDRRIAPPVVAIDNMTPRSARRVGRAGPSPRRLAHV